MIKQMFWAISQISWTQYFSAIVILLLVYYVFLAVRFYRRDIQLFVQRLQKSRLQGSALKTAPSATSQKEMTTDPGMSAAIDEGPDDLSYEEDEAEQQLREAEALSFRLKAAIASAVERKYVREEFIQSLKSVLSPYPSLNTPAYKTAIGNLITSECEKQRGIQLSDNELATLWLT